MAKLYARPIALFAAVMVATLFLVALAGALFPQLSSGQPYDPESGGLASTLTALEQGDAPDRWHFTVTTDAAAPPLALLSARSGYLATSRGESLLVPASAPQFYHGTLKEEHFLPTRGDTRTLELEIAGLTTPGNSLLYLTTQRQAEQFFTWYSAAFVFGMGLTFLMVLYGGSLYLRKKSEGYLAWFAAYTASIFLWSLCSLPPDLPNAGTGLLFSAVYDLSAVLNTLICFQMCGIGQKGRFRWMFTRYGVVISMVLFLGAEVLFPAPALDLLRFAVYSVGAVALIGGCAQKRPGVWLLLVGYAISYGLRLSIFLGTLSLVSVNLLMIALRYSKIFNLPFAFACMFFINRRFADKFTEAETLAAALEQSNRNLDRKVEERTAALVRQQEQRRVFMMNIFHDLRTPLFILKGCAEELKADPALLPQRLPVIEDRLGFVGELTENLFLMAKLEDGQVILGTERVPLAPLLERVSAACRVEGEGKGVAVCFSPAAQATAWGDELRLGQVFQNLIANAVYYTPPGGGVDISLTVEEGRALVRVRDTGVGIAAEDLARIFDRYYRVTGADKHSSTGLGLSIAQELTRLHRGTITVESILGQGTTFTVSLPALTTE